MTSGAYSQGWFSGRSAVTSRSTEPANTDQRAAGAAQPNPSARAHTDHHRVHQYQNPVPVEQNAIRYAV
jgi:hypothetical protein